MEVPTASGQAFVSYLIELALDPYELIGVERAPQPLSARTRARSSRPIQSEPGSPRENGHVESCNGKLRDEVSDREIFHALREARVLPLQDRQTDNRIRPDTSVAYRPPADILPAKPIPMLVGLILLGIQTLGTGQQHSQRSASWCIQIKSRDWK